jgi:hypothetical protein
MKLLTGMKAAFGKRSGLMLKITLSLIVALLVCSVGLRSYSRHAVQRALSMLSEAALIKVGDKEEAVLPLVARYGGTKSYPRSIPGRQRKLFIRNKVVAVSSVF